MLRLFEDYTWFIFIVGFAAGFFLCHEAHAGAAVCDKAGHCTPLEFPQPSKQPRTPDAAGQAASFVTCEKKLRDFKTYGFWGDEPPSLEACQDFAKAAEDKFEDMYNRALDDILKAPQ
jgi:hypothetical protein